MSTIKKFKLPKISFKVPKTPNSKNKTPFNFAKFTKLVKLPKAKKITLMKKAIKKSKNAGF